MGSDNLINFHKWDGWKKFSKNMSNIDFFQEKDMI